MSNLPGGHTRENKLISESRRRLAEGKARRAWARGGPGSDWAIKEISPCRISLARRRERSYFSGLRVLRAAAKSLRNFSL